MPAIDAVLFDIDSTLLRGRVSEAVAATCERISDAHPQFVVGELIASNERVWKDHGDRLVNEWTIGVRDGASVAVEAWRLTLAGSGCLDESTVRLAVETYIHEESKTFRLFDDVLPLIEFLRSLRIPMGVVTNGASDSQRTKLHTTEVLEWFDTVVASGDVGIAKPDPRIFEIALETLGARPQNTWHIGDTPETDIAGARAASVKAVWINRHKRQLGTAEPRPDLEVSSLTDLLSLLQEALGK